MIAAGLQDIMTEPFLRIGTRGSPLALAQTHLVRRLIAEAHGMAQERIEVVVIRTTGDAIQDRPLSESGGKGLFTKELDAALLEGSIDLAVHSSKDLPTVLPEGLCVAGYLPREDVRDVLITAHGASFADLPHGAKLGTASLRRGAQAKRLRPDLELTLLRGNVETRLRKAETGEVDATLLALAGLKRLGLAHRATCVLSVEDFLPAVGQGAIGIATRTEDHATRVALGAIFDDATGCALTAERAFLRVLDGSCRTPIAGHATVLQGVVMFKGTVLRADGSQAWDVEESGHPDEAEMIGARAGRRLLDVMPPDVLP
jgi:hydroxymethylbilane synthase